MGKKEWTKEQAMDSVVKNLTIGLARRIQINIQSEAAGEEIPEGHEWRELTVEAAVDRLIAESLTKSQYSTWLPEAIIKHKLNREEISAQVKERLLEYNLDKKVYSLAVGRQERGYHFDGENKVIKYRGNTNKVQGLLLPSINAAHKVMELSGDTTYMIFEHDVEITQDGDERVDDYQRREKAIFVTEDITEYENASRKAAEKDKREREEKVKRINELATEFPFKTYKSADGTMVEVFAERTEASYRPAYSKKIQYSVYLTYRKKKEISGEGEKPRGFSGLDMESYRSRSNAKLLKKFKEEMGFRFPADVAKAMAKDFEKLENFHKEVKAQVRNA